MIVRRGIPLRWRIAVLTAVAIGVLSVVTVITAYFAARTSLLSNLQQGLREDVENVARTYLGEVDTAEELLTVRDAPTGGVIIQLYDTGGQLIAASDGNESPEAAIPPDVVRDFYIEGVPRDWRGELQGMPVRAALSPFNLEPFELGVAVVYSPIGFIGQSLRQLAQALAITAVIMIILSAALSYLVAAAAMRPITQLANLAAEVDPRNLRPLEVQGPSDEVGKLGEVLNDLVLRLKEALDAQRSFLAETSHELRTPLTSLQGFLERASRRADPGVQRDLEDAKRISQTMSRLVADLLQLSRGELVQEIVPHLLDPCSDILEPVAEEFQGVALCAAAGETLVGDPERLRQLLRNLAANAVRATGDPTQVELRLHHTADSVVMEVSDTGPGIPAEQLPHIFDKFYKGVGGGAGLGLAIAKQIADVHQGELYAESEVGKGTTFRLVLPALETAEDTSWDF